MHLYRLLLPASFPLLLCACSPRLYYPDRANVPAFKEAREVRAVASVKLQNGDHGGSAICPAADVAYSPVKHLGIIASYRSVMNRDGYLYPTYDKPGNYSFNNTSILLNGNRLEGGAGYYTSLGHRGGVFEAYGGYGNGALTGDQRFTTRYHRFFAQSEAGFSNDIISVMGGIRIAAQRYYNFQSADSALLYRINADPSYYNSTTAFTQETFWFAEPFINMEVGYRYVSFNTQVGFSAQVDHNSSIIGDSNIFLSFGIVIHWAPLKQRTALRN